MQVGFYCLDGAKVTHEECLAHCRMGRRCLSLPTLRKMAETREWKDGQVPSVTQLLKGTLEAYLLITTPYYVYPKKQAFLLDGTEMHGMLEQYAKEGEIAEKRVTDDVTSGQADYLEPDQERPGEFILYDYKKYGSFAVAKLLLDYIRTIPKLDGNGNPIILKSGKNKGGFKMLKTVDESLLPLVAPESSDVSMQVNKYRTMFEKELGLKVSRMTCQITVRDGGTLSAHMRGLHDKMYMVDIPRLADEFVDTTFAYRSGVLMDALKRGTPPAICTDEERWNDSGEDKKCLEYCSVSFACPHGKTLKNHEEEE